jgi:hypothetical protein
VSHGIGWGYFDERMELVVVGAIARPVSEIAVGPSLMTFAELWASAHRKQSARLRRDWRIFAGYRSHIQPPSSIVAA